MKSDLNNEYTSKVRVSKDMYFLFNNRGEEEEMYENSNAISEKNSKFDYIKISVKKKNDNC